MTFDDEFADILGEKDAPPPPKKEPKRLKPPLALPTSQPVPNKTPTQTELYLLTQLNEGVSVMWLSAAFGLTHDMVRRKVSVLPAIGQRGKNVPLYPFIEAAKILAPMKIDKSELIASLKPSDMPLDLQKEYWDARLKKQRWQEKAKHLWRTEDVFDVLGETFKTIKSTVQLWSDNVDRAAPLTDEQREIIMRMSDALLDDIHRGLIEMAQNRNTPAQIVAEDEV